MNDREFQLAGVTYRVGKMNARTQFHVVRRIAPLMPPLLPVVSKIIGQEAAAHAKDGKDEGAEAHKALEKKRSVTETMDLIGHLLQPFTDGLASMKDADAEFVFDNCLDVVTRQQGSNWVPIWNKQHAAPLWPELDDVSLQLRIVVNVIKVTLAPFMQGLFTAQEQPQQVPAA